MLSRLLEQIFLLVLLNTRRPLNRLKLIELYLSLISLFNLKGKDL